MNVYYLIGKDTIDIDIYNSVMEKMKITNQINAGIEISEDEKTSSVFDDVLINLIR